MSHILDALRQAEQERHLGKPVTRSTIAGPLRAPRRQRRPGRLLLPAIAVLLLVAVVAGAGAWWLMARDDGTAIAAATPESRQVAPPEALPIVAAWSRESTAGAAAGTEGPPRARVHDSPQLRDIDALLPAREQPPDSEAQRMALAPFDLSREAAPQQQPAPSSRTDQPASAPAGSTPAEREAAAAIPTIDEAVPLPGPRAFGLQEVSIDVHVYDPNPAQRFILVGGRRYNTGDTLPGDLRLRGIEADSVVLEYDGQRMRQRMR